MSTFNCGCSCKCNCGLIAIIASVVLGVIAAFLQITGIITVGDTFLWVVFGIAVLYLAVLIIASAVDSRDTVCGGKCGSLGILLAGIIGTVLVSVILLAVGVTATSVISAILVGLLVLSFALIVGGSACYIKCLADCGE